MIKNLGEDLLRYKFDQKWLVWDVETESLNLGFSRPWQISWVVGKGKKIIESFDRYIKWDDLKVSEGAAQITGFNYGLYITEAEDARETLDLFESYLYNPEYLVSGHNILGFDIYQHNVWRRELGLTPDYSYLERCYDTLAFSRAYKMGIKLSQEISKKDLTLWQFKILSHYDKKIKCSLSAMAKEFDIYFDHTMLHNAIYDVEINYKVLWSLLNQMKIK